MVKYGKVLDIVVCENAGQHLGGNTYVKFEDEEQAQKCLQAVAGRFYAGRPLFAEYTPVTDFWEGVCKQLEKDGICSRGPNCNFMHLKKIGKTLEKELYPEGRGGVRGAYSGGGYGNTSRTGRDDDWERRDDRQRYENYNKPHDDRAPPPPRGGSGGGGDRRDYDSGRRDDRRDDRRGGYDNYSNRDSNRDYHHSDYRDRDRDRQYSDRRSDDRRDDRGRDDRRDDRDRRNDAPPPPPPTQAPSQAYAGADQQQQQQQQQHH